MKGCERMLLHRYCQVVGAVVGMLGALGAPIYADEAIAFAVKDTPAQATATQDAADPPQVAALKAAGMKVLRQRTWWCSVAAGWKIEAGQTKMTEELWKQVEGLPEITGIYIGGEGFGDAELHRLCRISTVQVLGLDGAPVTDAGFAALANLKQLQTLMVGHTYKFNGTGVKALKGSKSLIHLEMGGSGLDDKGMAAISELTQVKELVLRHDRYTRASLPLIAKMTNLETLEINPQWNAQNVVISDLAALASLPSLKDLNIGNMVLPWQDGMSVLKRFKGLKTLRLYGDYLTDEDLAKARAELPGVTFDVRPQDFATKDGPAFRDNVLMQYKTAIEDLRKQGLYPPRGIR